MYRSGNEYDDIAKEVIRIYLDYDIRSFPIDEREVCRKLGVSLVPYSEVNEELRMLLLKKTQYGIYVKRTSKSPPTIYFNDSFDSKGAQRITIFHEIKHYIYDEDSSDEEYDDLADYFAKYFLCPIPLLICMGLSKPNEIVSWCEVSMTVADNVSSNIYNRRKKYGDKIFDYELPLVDYFDFKNNIMIERC